MSQILLDTHTFLWAITGDPRLDARHRAIFLNQDQQLFLSIASIWEMIIKHGLGRLPLPVSKDLSATAFLTGQMDQNQIQLLPIRPSHLAELERLPPLHKDPFDRILAAQARAEHLPLLTIDPQMKAYRVKLR